VYHQEFRAFLVIDRCAVTLIDETAGATLCTALCDYKHSAAKDTQSGACTGTVVVNSVPCRVQLKFGKTFKAKGPCPPDV
jgi:hypothetical protein